VRGISLAVVAFAWDANRDDQAGAQLLFACSLGVGSWRLARGPGRADRDPPSRAEEIHMNLGKLLSGALLLLAGAFLTVPVRVVLKATPRHLVPA
jgi:hypothetical protein